MRSSPNFTVNVFLLVRRSNTHI